MVLQPHSEENSLRGVSRTTKLAHNTVFGLVRVASAKGQMVHNKEVQKIEIEQIAGDEFWSYLQKNCLLDELRVGDCWIGMNQATGSGLILAVRAGKHADEFIQELVMNTEGKTDCQQWCTDGWGGYQRVLGDEVSHTIGKEQTQQLERMNGTVRQQTGRWRHAVSPLGHRRQNKFAKVWE